MTALPRICSIKLTKLYGLEEMTNKLSQMRLGSYAEKTEELCSGWRNEQIWSLRDGENMGLEKLKTAKCY